jgi:hypothetical protein
MASSAADGEEFDWLLAQRLEDILEARCFYEEDSVLFLQHD